MQRSRASRDCEGEVPGHPTRTTLATASSVSGAGASRGALPALAQSPGSPQAKQTGARVGSIQQHVRDASLARGDKGLVEFIAPR
jgi:hypothetical protein